MDLTGLEPVTFAMPWRRSTGLSYRPERILQITGGIRSSYARQTEHMFQIVAGGCDNEPETTERVATLAA